MNCVRNLIQVVIQSPTVSSSLTEKFNPQIASHEPAFSASYDRI